MSTHCTAVGNVAAIQQDAPKPSVTGPDQLTMQQRYRNTGTSCCPTALAGLVQPGLKSPFFRSCGAAAAQPAVHEHFSLQCGHGLNSQGQGSTFFSSEQLQEGSVASGAGPELSPASLPPE